ACLESSRRAQDERPIKLGYKASIDDIVHIDTKRGKYRKGIGIIRDDRLSRFLEFHGIAIDDSGRSHSKSFPVILVNTFWPEHTSITPLAVIVPPVTLANIPVLPGTSIGPTLSRGALTFMISVTAHL